MMKAAILILLAGFAMGCADYRWPAQNEAYDVACEVLALDESLPDVDRPGMDEAVISLGKNMGCVELPLTGHDVRGSRAEDVYVVWVKRVRLRWEPDRVGWGSGGGS